MTEDQLEAIASHAYNAYGLTTEFKNYAGLPMPPWENLPPTIQLAWKNAVKAARIFQVQETV